MNQLRTSRLVVGVILGVICLCAIWFIVTGPPGQGQQTLNGDRLANALARYSRDVARQGQGVPASVSLETLLQAGYITPEDAKPFGEAKVTFYATADTSNPQSILIAARMPDGSAQVVLADGSVQQFSAGRLEEALRTNIARSLSTNARQPMLSTTNMVSPKAGTGSTN